MLSLGCCRAAARPRAPRHARGAAAARRDDGAGGAQRHVACAVRRGTLLRSAPPTSAVRGAPLRNRGQHYQRPSIALQAPSALVTCRDCVACAI